MPGSTEDRGAPFYVRLSCYRCYIWAGQLGNFKPAILAGRFLIAATPVLPSVFTYLR